MMGDHADDLRDWEEDIETLLIHAHWVNISTEPRPNEFYFNPDKTWLLVKLIQDRIGGTQDEVYNAVINGTATLYGIKLKIGDT